MTTEKETDWVAKIGKPAYDSICDMVAALECDYERLEELKAERDADPQWATENPDEAEELAELEAAAGDCTDREDAERRIHEDPLSLRIFGERTDGKWEADRFELLLATGGPAVRIMGELDSHGEPDRAWLEVQDWFKPWSQFFGADQDKLLTYCRCFYFAE